MTIQTITGWLTAGLLLVGCTAAPARSGGGELSVPQADVRQVAMVDAEGRVAVHTGERCIR